MRGVRVVDVLVQQRTSHVEHALTYLVPDGMTLGIGDVVRVPLGPRELYGFVLGAPREVEAQGLRAIAARVETHAAFDREGLALAEWIAERYCCTLGEALGPMVYAAGIPRVVDRFVPVGELDSDRFASAGPPPSRRRRRRRGSRRWARRPLLASSRRARPSRNR